MQNFVVSDNAIDSIINILVARLQINNKSVGDSVCMKTDLLVIQFV